MARLFYTGSATAASSSTDTANYVTRASVTFTPTAGKSYAVFWSATCITNSTTAQSVRIRLQDTTNAVTYQQFLQTPELATNVENFSVADVSAFTAASATSRTLAVQFTPSAGTMTIRDVYITVLELFDDEVFSTNSADTANITTATPVSLASVTVNPGEWYLVASAGAKSNDASATGQGATDYQFQINDGAVNVAQRFGLFANNVSDYEPVLLIADVVPTVSTTYTFQAAENGNNTLNCRYRTIVALKKSNFADANYAEATADNTNTTTTPETAVTLTHTPIANVPYLVLGTWNAGTSAQRVNSNFTQAGTSKFVATPSRDPNDPDGRFSHGIFYTEAQGTTSRTWLINYNISATTATATINNAVILILNLGSDLPTAYSFGYILL
jgi:hypothetical protein